MKRFWWTTLVLMVLTAVAPGCVRTSDGVPVRGGEALPTTNAAPQPTPHPPGETGISAPGVVATSRAPIPPDSVTCAQPVRPAVKAVAQVPDPQAPQITVAVPNGWSVAAGSGDIGIRLDGPDRMSATVTIVQTQLDPEQAFSEYVDEVMAKSSVSSVSVLPAPLCGYSGQKLMGNWSDTPQQSVEFIDRIAHVWTNSNNYLVAIHVEAPSGTDGFDAASTVLIEDFAVGIT
jgi:hypothetical protein